MPSKATLQAFLDMVIAGQHAEAIEEFYAEDATMQENLGATRYGRANLVAHERATLARFKSVKTTLVPPVFAEGDFVVIHWIFEFLRANGGVVRIEELAHQRWKGEKIAQERFYYDPGQRRG